MLRLLYGLGIRLGLVLGFRDRVRVKVRVSFRIVTFVYTFGFSPFAEISGISIVMHVSELFVDGKCIIGSVVRRTLARGRHLLFNAILTCRIS